MRMAILATLVLGLIVGGAFLTQANDFGNQVRTEERGGYRYIYANGIPDHATGTFPNSGNPNTISPQRHIFRMTLTPQLTGRATPARPTFGVALNGVPFEPGTAEYWHNDRTSGWNYDALSGRINLGLDANNAHVQPTGSYHYHGLPTALVSAQTMTLVGYAADGFPIYGHYGYADANDASSGLVAMYSSYRLKSGQRPSGPLGRYDGTFVQDFEYVAGLGDLDECNGRFGVTPDYPAGIYHYYITEQFPFVSRCVQGTPDESFVQVAPQGEPGMAPRLDNGQGSDHPSHPPGPPGNRPSGPPPSNRPPATPPER